MKELEEIVPFNISFWFSGSEFSTEMEFNSEQNFFKSLKNIEIHFKLLKDRDQYEISQKENSDIKDDDYLIWKIDEMSEDNESASLILNFTGNVS